MRIIFILLSVFTSAFYGAFAEAKIEECDSLIQYRDGPLFVEHEKYLRKIEGLENSIDLYMSLSEDIESSSTAQILAIADALLVASKATSEIVSAAVPPAWIAKSAATDVTKALQLEILTAGDSSRDLYKLMNEATVYESSKILLKYSGTGVGSSLSSVAEAVETIADGAERSKDWTEIIKLLRREEQKIEEQLNLLNNGIEEYRSTFTKANSVKNTIDEFCNNQMPEDKTANGLSNLNGKFLILEGSSKTSGSAIIINSPYLSSCTWQRNESTLTSIAIEPPSNYTPMNHFASVAKGLQSRQGKLDKDTGSARFRNGRYTMVGNWSFKVLPAGIEFFQNNHVTKRFVSADSLSFANSVGCTE